MSQPLVEASAEARLVAFNLFLEAVRGGSATESALARARDMATLADAVLAGQAHPGHVRARIEAALSREMEPV